MRVGSIVYATEQGLGILAKSFYSHGVVTDVLVNLHRYRPNKLEWYPDSLVISNIDEQMECVKSFCRRMDCMLFFETPFEWSLIPYCHKHGVMTVLMPMYECMPANLPYLPSRILCPSVLDLQYYPNGVYIPVPVEVEWKLRERAEVFVHNAGNFGIGIRNGTLEVLQALRYLKSPLKLKVRMQGFPFGDEERRWEMVKELEVAKGDSRLELEIGTVPFSELWKEGDVFVFPERFNGLSLPLQEACAAGMLVMASDRFPMNTWLPKAPLIPVSQYRRTRLFDGAATFYEALIDPKDVAAKMDEWFGADIRGYSLHGKRWSEQHSWEVLRPRYMEVLRP